MTDKLLIEAREVADWLEREAHACEHSAKETAMDHPQAMQSLLGARAAMLRRFAASVRGLAHRSQQEAAQEPVDLVMLEKLVYGWILHNGKPTNISGFLKSASTVVDALRRGGYLRTSLSPTAVMWRCKDYADGWIVFHDRSQAEAYRDTTGCLMQAMGVVDVTPSDATSPTLQSRIKELITEHGTLRAVSRVLAIDCGYLSRLEHGDKTHPSDEVLAKLGLREVTRYERITDAALSASNQNGGE